MHLEGLLSELFALLEFLGNVWIAGGGHEGREPIEPGNDPVLDLAGRDAAWPSNHAWHAEAAFQRCSLAARERRLAAIRPGKILRTIVGGEHHDGVVVEALVPELLHDRADDIVKLSETSL